MRRAHGARHFAADLIEAGSRIGSLRIWNDQDQQPRCNDDLNAVDRRVLEVTVRRERCTENRAITQRKPFVLYILRVSALFELF
jgi:hypothetical protein